MLLRRTAAPADFLTLSELKAHLRIDHSYEDTALEFYRKAAQEYLDGREGYLGRSLCSQTWEWLLPLFPYGKEIHIPLPPLQSITSIEYYDGSNALQTFASDNYAVRTEARTGYLALNADASWPATYEREDAVKITFVAGYGAASAVPSAIKWAAMLIAGRLYANRGDQDDSTDKSGDAAMTTTERNLLASFRIQEFCTPNEQYWFKARALPHR